MTGATTRIDLAGGMAIGRLRVVDSALPLEQEMPVLLLPQPFPSSATVWMVEASRCDKRDPAQYWNALNTVAA